MGLSEQKLPQDKADPLDPVELPPDHPVPGAGEVRKDRGALHGGGLLPVHGHALPGKYPDQEGLFVIRILAVPVTDAACFR